MATLAQIHALSKEEVKQIVHQHQLKGEGGPWHLVAQAYAERGGLVAEDVPFAGFLKGYNGPSPSSPGLWMYISGTLPPEAVPQISALSRGLQGEQLVAYLAIRLMYHLGSTLHYRREEQEVLFFSIEQERPVVQNDAGGYELEDPYEEVPGIEWYPEATEERKVSDGLSLAADLAMGTYVGPLENDFFERTYSVNGDVVHRDTLGEMWNIVLQDAALAANAYRDLRASMDYIEHLKTHPHHLTRQQLAYPASIGLTSLRELIDGVSDSLYAHLQRNLVRLPQPGQAYLEYVNRVLMNYRIYGVAGLRPSDLLDGDAVFRPVGGPLLPAVNKTGLLPVGVRQMVDEYLVKVPTDATILQRLRDLPPT